MRILVLDLSLTSTGWVVLEGEKGQGMLPSLRRRGSLGLGVRIQDCASGKYPWSYIAASRRIGQMVMEVLEKVEEWGQIDNVVIEETNGARARFVQKALEFMHFAVLQELQHEKFVEYVSTADWRKAVGIQMTPEDKRRNAALRRAQKTGKLAAKRKELGVRGRVNKKHLALRWVKERYGLDLKVNENDQAEAICIGVAWFKGAPISTGDLAIKKRPKGAPNT